MIWIISQKGTVDLAAQVVKRDIDSRVAKELGLSIAKTEEVIDKFLEVLREECSSLEKGETLAYRWLGFKCYMTKDYIPEGLEVICPGVTSRPPNPRLKIKASIKSGFYADEKKGLEGNWYV